MESLTERLEVRLAPQTMRLLRQEAELRGASVAAVVREAIDLLLAQDRQARIRAAQALFRVEAPVADWPAMEQEIEASYLDAGRP